MTIKNKLEEINPRGTNPGLIFVPGDIMKQGNYYFSSLNIFCKEAKPMLLI